MRFSLWLMDWKKLKRKKKNVITLTSVSQQSVSQSKSCFISPTLQCEWALGDLLLIGRYWQYYLCNTFITLHRGGLVTWHGTTKNSEFENTNKKIRDPDILAWYIFRVFHLLMLVFSLFWHLIGFIHYFRYPSELQGRQKVNKEKHHLKWRHSLYRTPTTIDKVPCML